MNYVTLGQNAATATLNRDAVIAAGPGLVIAVMGETGSGKSTFINTVIGNDIMDVGRDLQSCTTTLVDAQLFLDGHTVRLIDTPGFSDTHLSDTEVLKRIASYLEGMYRAGIKLSGIVYLHKLTNDKMVGSARKNLQMYRKLVGRKGLQNVVLASTKAQLVHDRTEADHRHHQLKTIYWKDMIDEGSKVWKYDGERETALRIVRSIMGNHPRALQIQRELVNEGMDLLETAAGAELNAELLAERRKKDAEVAEVKRLQEEERVEMKKEREEERKQAQAEQERIRREAETARQNDRKLHAELLEEQLVKEKKASEEREHRWRLEQEEILESNTREFERMREERDEAERKSRREQEALSRYREEQQMQQINQAEWQRQQGYGDNAAVGFFAWAAALLALPFLV
ncbi:hypothetical protein MMC27_005135 [Xylographa pallens]|nr:hypothetical protein [Xylographa pallens]